MSENESQTPEVSIKKYVHERISSIQENYLSAGNKSRGARKLAALRHALQMPIGANADAWPIEFEGFPAELAGKGPEPSRAELAVHGALTLYAFHQQGQTMPMHKSGNECGIGCAVRRLVLQEKEHYANLETGEMPRRFRAFITAESMEETLHYARQLVQQLRAASIPLDYALLAAQLYDLQNPYKVDSIRLVWGRGYSFLAPTPNADDSAE